jgi:hypothetical protein
MSDLAFQYWMPVWRREFYVMPCYVPPSLDFEPWCPLLLTPALLAAITTIDEQDAP